MKTVINYLHEHWEAIGAVIASIAAFFGGRRTKKITDRSGELENLQTVRDLEKQIVEDVKSQVQELREINSGLQILIDQKDEIIEKQQDVIDQQREFILQQKQEIAHLKKPNEKA